jgi:hypothetical protein
LQFMFQSESFRVTSNTVMLDGGENQQAMSANPAHGFNILFLKITDKCHAVFIGIVMVIFIKFKQD